VRTNPVAIALRTGGTALGTFVIEFRSPAMARIAAAAGAEFIVFDQEHSGLGTDELRVMLSGARAASIVPLVRVGTAENHLIAAALDLGALGVVAPMIDTSEQARLLVAAAKYPPVGTRGFGILHDDEHNGEVARYLTHMNEATLVVAQIERAEGVENADAIAEVDGIDALWIGQYDLSVSLGIPGEFGAPVFLEAIDHVVQAVRRHRKAAAIAGDDPEWLEGMAQRGFRCLCFGHDISLYRSALREGLAELRQTSLLVS